MTRRLTWMLAGVALALAVRATEVVIGEHNGDASVVRSGRLIAWNLNAGVMTLEYETDRIFGDGFD